MTRQFTAGLSTYEELLTREAATGQGVMQLWNVTDYLILATRVVGDLQRPVPTLEKLAKDETLPGFVRHDIQGWLGALKELGTRPTDGVALTEARALIEEARSRSEFPYDRAGLIHYSLASRILLQYVDQNREQGEALAEAYYLLGMVEAQTGRSSWLSTPELYLDTAIRTAPGGPLAEKALALLEWYTAIEFTGSAGTELPPDVEAGLAELKELMRQARTP